MRIQTFSDDVFSLEGVLDQATCRTLIERGESLGFQRASVRTAGGPKEIPGIRDNDRAEFTDPILASELWALIGPHVPPTLDGGTADSLDDNFRFYRYDVGQRFRRHRDGAIVKSPAVRSLLTCLVYLNDDFTGGETAFYAETRRVGARDVEFAVTPRTGDALLFRHDCWHEGRALSAGRKYVLRTDVLYRFGEKHDSTAKLVSTAPSEMSDEPVVYSLEPSLSADEFIDVLVRSTLSERRPVGNRETIEAMLRGANVVVTARIDGRLVGVSRAITDFSYCTYLSDLAVDEAHQRRGIGRELIRRTHEAAGLHTTLILLAAPKAAEYYPHIGMTKHDSCWIVPRTQDE